MIDKALVITSLFVENEDLKNRIEKAILRHYSYKNVHLEKNWLSSYGYKLVELSS